MHGYRFSMKGFEQQNWMTNIPLFAVKAFIEKKIQEGNIDRI